MNNKYGLAAIDAVMLIQSERIIDPRIAWESALSKYFNPKAPALKKGCPRNTFLGLCQEGIIVGVKAGEYTRSKKNKEYALNAIEEIKHDPSIISDIDFLWKKASKNQDIVHNSQMDVVIALYKNGFINFKDK